jgi:hypothetical protein
LTDSSSVGVVVTGGAGRLLDAGDDLSKLDA